MPVGDRYSSILFDLDGTLTNPKLGITRSVQFALRRFGIEAGSLDALEPYIGPPLRQSFKTFHHLTEPESSQALQYYREYFERQGMLENAEYPGVRELLQGLKHAGKALFVATSKPRVYARKILAHFRMDGFFHAIEGSELDETRSDKGELIAYMIRTLGLRPGESVMVGDRMHDVEAASRNGLSSIGVGYGFGTREELEAAGATHYVRTTRELAELFLGNGHGGEAGLPQIIQCRPGDLDALRRVSCETYDETFHGMTSAQTMEAYLQEAFSADTLRAELAAAGCRFYFLRVGDAIGGYLKLNEAPSQSDLNDPASLEIERIYVRKLFQGRGLGKILLDHAVSEARLLGKRYVWLGVWEKNVNAISFYRKMGFTEAGRHPFRMGEEIQSDLVMKKTLS